jgi:hypothetical protein
VRALPFTTLLAFLKGLNKKGIDTKLATQKNASVVESGKVSKFAFCVEKKSV